MPKQVGLQCAGDAPQNALWTCCFLFALSKLNCLGHCHDEIGLPFRARWFRRVPVSHPTRTRVSNPNQTTPNHQRVTCPFLEGGHVHLGVVPKGGQKGSNPGSPIEAKPIPAQRCEPGICCELYIYLCAVPKSRIF